MSDKIYCLVFTLVTRRLLA